MKADDKKPPVSANAPFLDAGVATGMIMAAGEAENHGPAALDDNERTRQGRASSEQPKVLPPQPSNRKAVQC